MKKLCQVLVVLSFLGSFFIFNPTLQAAEGLKVGEAEITPWGEITVQYDDNVFLEPDNEKDDIIVTLTPGVGLELPFDDHLFTFDYHADINRFTDYSSQDATEHYVSGDLELNFQQDLTFNIYDDYKRVYDRPSTEDTTRVKRADNTIGIKGKLQKERLGVQLGYEHFTRDYLSEDTYDVYDRNENIYSLVLTHQTFPKTELLLEYDFGQVRYDEDVRSDSDYHQILVGAVGQVTEKTTATVKAGYQMRDYDRDSEPDFDTGVLYSELIHKFSNRDALKLSFLRSAEESTYDVNNYYKIENVTAIYDHYFTAKLLGFVNGLYQINSYPRESTEGTETKKRKDKYYSLGAGLRYYMKEWLTLTLKAEHIARDSNFGVYDYDENLFTVSARAEF